MKKLFLTTSMLALLGTAAYVGATDTNLSNDDENGNGGNASQKVQPSLADQIALKKAQSAAQDKIFDLEPQVCALLESMDLSLSGDEEFEETSGDPVKRLAFLNKTLADLEGSEDKSTTESTSTSKAEEETQGKVTIKHITLVGKKATYGQIVDRVAKMKDFRVDDMKANRGHVRVYDSENNVFEVYKVPTKELKHKSRNRNLERTK